MENLIFSLNATLPVFLIIAAGMGAKRVGLINDNYVSVANKFNFRVCLPIMLFLSMRNSDTSGGFDLKFMALIIACSAAECVLSGVIARVCVHEPSKRGSFAQGSFRGNTALIGLAMIMNMYGESKYAAVAVMCAIPVYNAGAVTVLSLFGGENNKSVKDIVLNIVKNPLIIGTLAGMAASVLDIHFPTAIETSLEYLSDITMGSSLLCIGAAMDLGTFVKSGRTAVFASALKLVIFPLIFMPVMIAAGYRTDALASAFIVLGSPAAVNSYIMAVSMKNDGALASSIIVISSLLGALTMTAWIAVLRYAGLL